MRSRLLAIWMVALVVSCLTGCGDSGVLANFGQSLSGVASPVLGLLDPVLGRFFPKSDAPVASTPVVRPHRRPRNRLEARPGSAASASLGATSSLDPKTVFAGWADRNKKFDRLRTAGLLQLYGGQTAQALESFKQAQTLRPEDEQINHLVALCEHPQAFMSKEQVRSLSSSDPNAPTIPQPLEPPSVPTTEAPSRLQGALNAVGQQLKSGAGGDKPGGLF